MVTLKYENKYDIKNWSDRPKIGGTNTDEPLSSITSNPTTIPSENISLITNRCITNLSMK